MKKADGFTLIELLVVIGIIGVLLGLLIPNVVAAREQAKAMVCGSNLRSIGQLCSLYAADNQDHTPPVFIGMNLLDATGASYASGYYSPHEILQITGYVYMPLAPTTTALAGGKSIFICPSARTDTTRTGVASPDFSTRTSYDSLLSWNDGGLWGRSGLVPSQANTLSSAGYLNTSYSVNSCSVDSGANYPFSDMGSNPVSSVKTGKFSRPGETVMLVDGPSGCNLCKSDGNISFRHNNLTRTNVLFLDNHCESLDNQISSAATHQRKAIPNSADTAFLGGWWGSINPASTLIWYAN